jgi:hypothetical protein
MSRSGLILLALLGAAIMILDGYDLQVIALVVPLISRHGESRPVRLAG